MPAPAIVAAPKWWVLLELLIESTGGIRVDIRTFSERQPTQPRRLHEARALYGALAGPLATFEEAEAERRRLVSWLFTVRT